MSGRSVLVKEQQQTSLMGLVVSILNWVGNINIIPVRWVSRSGLKS